MLPPLLQRSDVRVMRLPFPNDIVRIDGALGVVRTDRGVSPRRLPTWTDARVTDLFLEFDVAATAGVRLAFRTSSSTIALTLRCNALRVNDQDFGVVVDLLVEGEHVARRDVPGTGLVHLREGAAAAGGSRWTSSTTDAAPSVLTFDGLGERHKQVEIWLPQGATCEVLALETSEPIEPPAEDNRPVWIHHGSSISHCTEALGPIDTWPGRAALSAGRSLIDLGFAGQAVVDQFVARVIRDTPADFISVKLGINVVGGRLMRERTFRSAVDGFLDTIRDGHPETPILVISAIACADFETDVADGELSLARSREILAEIVERRRGEHESTEYLDGRELLGPDEIADLPDGVHPSPAGYLRMADRFTRLALLS